MTVILFVALSAGLLVGGNVLGTYGFDRYNKRMESAGSAVSLLGFLASIPIGEEPAAVGLMFVCAAVTCAIHKDESASGDPYTGRPGQRPPPQRH